MSVRLTASDVAAWVGLVAQVERSLVRPQRSTLELERACDRARKAVLPVPPYSPENPYIALLRTASAFVGMTSQDRAVARDGLDAALVAAQALRPIETGEASPLGPRPPPKRPFRADIDG